MIELALIAACAPDVAPATIQEIIRVESAGNMLAINVNKLPPSDQPKTGSQAEAAAIARFYIGSGHTVDMGLMQINSANLGYLGFDVDSLETLFSPCVNINGGAQILTESYQRAAKIFGEGQKALQAALSSYNTGNFKGGLNNGYVSKIYNQPHSQPLASPDILAAPTAVSWNPPANYYPTTTIPIGFQVATRRQESEAP